jgi:tetratricopeptide (TPR) repeat protein
MLPLASAVVPEPSLESLADLAIAAAVADLKANRVSAAHQRAVELAGWPGLDPGRSHIIGLLALGTGAFAAALAAFDAALAAGGSDPALHYNRGNALKALGRIDAAIGAYDTALRLRPAYPEALRAGGVILRDTGRVEAAEQFLREALRLEPGFREAALDLGGLLQARGQTEAAVAVYEAALAARPRDGELLNNLGVALQRLGRLDPALACLDAAILVTPTLPTAHFNRGNVLLQLQRPDAALSAFERALALRPDYVEARCSRAVALKYVERYDEALAAFDAALAADPHSAHAKNNKAALLLLRGDFERGLEDYEFRWIAADTPKQALARFTPEWAGVTRPGDRILIHDEQGLGDVLQFCRYLPLLARQGAEVTFHCRPRLHRLLESLAGRVRLVAEPPADPFDFQIALSSLPRAFRTRLDSVPAAVPYLSADPALVRRWADWLGPKGLRIGVCWHGNPDPKADPSRSIPLAAFEPLARVPGVRLVAIQQVDGLDALARLPAGMTVEVPPAFDAGADAFVDTAALMQSLDLVVTCDTSIAHLAGALGRPVWVLLKRVPDWRWLLTREDSPWYPTMRLFRQARRNDWAEVMARAAEAAQALREAASV